LFEKVLLLMSLSKEKKSDKREKRVMGPKKKTPDSVSDAEQQALAEQQFSANVKEVEKKVQEAMEEEQMNHPPPYLLNKVEKDDGFDPWVEWNGEGEVCYAFRDQGACPLAKKCGFLHVCKCVDLLVRDADAAAMRAGKVPRVVRVERDILFSNKNVKLNAAVTKAMLQQEKEERFAKKTEFFARKDARREVAIGVEGRKQAHLIAKGKTRVLSDAAKADWLAAKELGFDITTPSLQTPSTPTQQTPSLGTPADPRRSSSQHPCRKRDRDGQMSSGDDDDESQQ